MEQDPSQGPDPAGAAPDGASGSASGAPTEPDGDWGLGPVPAGFTGFQRRILLGASMTPGTGPAVDPALARSFERARALLRIWGPQVGVGIRVEGAAASVEVGRTAVLRARVGGLVPMTAPVRICWAVDEPDRAGFAYETRPGHPEEGRESFVVTRGANPEGFAEVWFTVTAYSRPAAWYARLGGPVTRMVQRRYANKYLLAMARAVRARGRGR